MSAGAFYQSLDLLKTHPIQIVEAQLLQSHTHTLLLGGFQEIAVGAIGTHEALLGKVKGAVEGMNAYSLFSVFAEGFLFFRVLTKRSWAWLSRACSNGGKAFFLKVSTPASIWLIVSQSPCST